MSRMIVKDRVVTWTRLAQCRIEVLDLRDFLPAATTMMSRRRSVAAAGPPGAMLAIRAPA